jgi:hypothetical protein
MRKLTAIALLTGLSFWAFSPEPSKAFAYIDAGEVFVINPQSGDILDAHVETSDFSNYCLGAGEANGAVSWSKPRKDVVVLACTFPKSEDTAGNRTGGTFRIHFHYIALEVYRLEKITSDIGWMSTKEVYNFAAAVREYAEKTNLNRKDTAVSKDSTPAQPFLRYDPDLRHFGDFKVWVLSSGEEIQTEVYMGDFADYCSTRKGQSVWEQKAINSFLLHCYKNNYDDLVHFTTKGNRVDLDSGQAIGQPLKSEGLLNLTTNIQFNREAMKKQYGKDK